MILDNIFLSLSTMASQKEQGRELDKMKKPGNDSKDGDPTKQKPMTVKAMNFSQGHWYKCPNGHIYAIGDCGGAMEQMSCPEAGCGAIIGGRHHTLAQGNVVVTEIDGAKYGAWSNQTNPQNYDPNERRRLQFK
ncbi:hypothetical protein ACROYT_G013274 [Oculina patagonica]